MRDDNTMNDYTTYIIGAGASAKCIPTVNQFEEKIEDQIQFLFKEENVARKQPFYNRNTSTLQKKYISDLRLLKTQCKNFASFDTVAKRFYLMGEKQSDNLIKLKNILTAFMLTEQLRMPPDLRYDAFFASILNYNAKNLPHYFKIVNWNNDLQFELAYSRYINESDTGLLRKYLNINSALDLAKKKENLVMPEFEILSMNGSCLWIDQNGKKINPLEKAQLKDSGLWNHAIYTTILLEYCSNKYTTEANFDITFAWENEADLNKIKNQAAVRASNIMRESNRIIVIGYSFPFYNKPIDDLIFSNYLGSSDFVIQCGNESESVGQRLLNLLPGQYYESTIEFVENLDAQFAIPH